MLQRYSNIQRELRAGWNIFVSVVAINAYTATRVFAVGLLTNNIITGYYSIAERIAGVIQSFPLDSLAQALYPRLNKIYKRNKDRAAKLMKRIQDSATFGFMVCLPVIYIATPLIVRLVCGSPYSEVIMTLRLLLLSVFLVGANAFRVQFLLVCGKPNLYSRLHLIAAILGLPLIFVCIYRFTFLGAAMASILIEAGILLATFRMIKRFT